MTTWVLFVSVMFAQGTERTVAVRTTFDTALECSQTAATMAADFSERSMHGVPVANVGTLCVEVGGK